MQFKYLFHTMILLIAWTSIAFGAESTVVPRSKAVKTALEAIKMMPDYLSIQPNISDPFRFSLINRALAKPVYLPEIIDTMASSLNFSSGASAFLNSCTFLLDIEPSSPTIYNYKDEYPWTNDLSVQPNRKTALTTLIDAFKDADVLYKDAFADLDSILIDSLFTRARKYLRPGPTKLDEEIDEATLEELDDQELVEERIDNRFFASAARIKRQKLHSAAVRIAQAAWSARELLKDDRNSFGEASAPDTLAFGDIIYYAETKYGPVIIGGSGPTVYLGKFAVIIDLGGDDEYRHAAGGADKTMKFSVAIDMNGSDIYWSDELFSFGAALGGVGILIDAQGNDLYRASSYSLGTGVFGWGILWDSEGDDIYSGKSGTQGVGFGGGGLLCDKQGNDVYESNIYAQGFGFVGGLGILSDLEGNDSYVCSGASFDKTRYADHNVSLAQGFGYGYRPNWSGGIGILLDQAGNDSYTADIFAQGAAHWFGFGAIYDANGRDTYSAYQFAQGSGVHYAVGSITDLAGDDAYVSFGESQGTAHDLAIGLLNDRHGDDNYITWDISQGAGNANGIGMLIDEGEGDDSYTARPNFNISGYGNWRRDFSSIGLMLDCGGKDVYLGKGSEGKWWSWSNYGVGIDFPDGVPEIEKK